jgi:hypothetical protein
MVAEQRKVDRRGKERRKNRALAKKYIGMERRVSERRDRKRRGSSSDSSDDEASDSEKE